MPYFCKREERASFGKTSQLACIRLALSLYHVIKHHLVRLDDAVLVKINDKDNIDYAQEVLHLPSFRLCRVLA